MTHTGDRSYNRIGALRRLCAELVQSTVNARLGRCDTLGREWRHVSFHLELLFLLCRIASAPLAAVEAVASSHSFVITRPIEGISHSLLQYYVRQSLFVLIDNHPYSCQYQLRHLHCVKGSTSFKTSPLTAAHHSTHTAPKFYPLFTMATVRDPAFWKRFSLAVHLNEEEKTGGTISSASSAHSGQSQHTKP